MAYELGISAADATFRVKHFTKEITNQFIPDHHVVFMTKPVVNADCGQEFNHTLHKVKSLDNAFYDGGAVNVISQVARYWLAGLVKHARGLTALCGPTVNCYRRLQGFSGPCTATSSKDGNDQTTSQFILNNSGTRIPFVTNRLPGGSANPYIVLAATVAAGLAGITNKYPVHEQDVDVLLLPKSLSEALDALEGDEVLVKALGVEFVETFIRNKREFEVDVLTGALTDESILKEREMYGKKF